MVFIVILVAFAILVIVRMFHFYNLKKTVAEVEKIHATKLTVDDVMGRACHRTRGGGGQDRRRN